MNLPNYDHSVVFLVFQGVPWSAMSIANTGPYKFG